MKKTLTAFWAVLMSCLTLAGCGTNERYQEAIWSTNEFEGISAVVEDVTASGLTATLDDVTEHEFFITGWSHIQIHKDDKWYEVPQEKEYVSPSSGEQSGSLFVVDWSETYGELAEGDYRVGLFFKGDVETRMPFSTWGYFSIQ